MIIQLEKLKINMPGFVAVLKVSNWKRQMENYSKHDNMQSIQLQNISEQGLKYYNFIVEHKSEPTKWRHIIA